MSVYLNECPICTGKAELMHAYETRTSYKAQDAYYCECPECGKSTDEFLTEEEAAEVWNKSGADDLKNTDERILRSVIIKPDKVWLDTFSRLILLFIGPVLLLFLVYSTKHISKYGEVSYNMAWWLWATYGIILAAWLGFGIPAYAKHAGKRNRMIKYIPKENRAANRLAVIIGIITAVIVLALIVIYIFIPIAEGAQFAETLPTESATMM